MLGVQHGSSPNLIDLKDLGLFGVESKGSLTATELGDDISDPQVASALKEWRRKSLRPDAIARAIRYALEQPEGVDVNEVIVRPTAANM